MSSPSTGNSFTDLQNQIMFGPGSAPLSNMVNLDPKFNDPNKTAKQLADEAIAEAQRKAAEAAVKAQDAANKATLAGGQGFVFNAEQINAVIDELDNTILPALRKAKERAQDMHDFLVPPGDEDVSIQYVGYIKSSAGSYIDYLNNEISGIEAKTKAFKAARDLYLKQDHSSEQSIKRV